jgi:hypothetical protein
MLLGESVTPLPEGDRKGIVPALRRPAHRRFSAHEPFPASGGCMS